MFKLGEPDSLNPYAYAQNKPITFSDPSGLVLPDASGSGDGVAEPVTGGTASVAEGVSYPTVLLESATTVSAEVVSFSAGYYSQQAGFFDFIANNAVPGGLPFESDTRGLVLDVFGLAGVDTEGKSFLTGQIAYEVSSALVPGGGATKVSKLPLVFKEGRGLAGLVAAGVRNTSALTGRASVNRLGPKTASSAARTCMNSFTASTPVLMADGTTKPIKDVKRGDKVIATDPSTGISGPRTVINLIRHSGPHTMVAVQLTDGTTINATDRHPFWVQTSSAWGDAISLQRGDVLMAADGSGRTVASVEVSRQDLTAYNLTVAGLHTYFAGSESVLVHNSGCSNITESGLTHSFDRHAAQWFGSQPTKAAQLAQWQGLIERTAGSSKVIPWSSGGTPTYAHLARIDGKYFAAQFSRETGDLVTAFVPNSGQLGAMLRLLGY